MHSQRFLQLYASETDITGASPRTVWSQTCSSTWKTHCQVSSVSFLLCNLSLIVLQFLYYYYSYLGSDRSITANTTRSRPMTEDRPAGSFGGREERSKDRSDRGGRDRGDSDRQRDRDKRHGKSESGEATKRRRSKSRSPSKDRSRNHRSSRRERSDRGEPQIFSLPNANLFIFISEGNASSLEFGDSNNSVPVPPPPPLAQAEPEASAEEYNFAMYNGTDNNNGAVEGYGSLPEQYNNGVNNGSAIVDETDDNSNSNPMVNYGYGSNPYDDEAWTADCFTQSINEISSGDLLPLLFTLNNHLWHHLAGYLADMHVILYLLEFEYYGAYTHTFTQDLPNSCTTGCSMPANFVHWKLPSSIEACDCTQSEFQHYCFFVWLFCLSL